MIVGLPKGLYYYKYGQFIEEFLDQLEIPSIVSPDTNKHILNEGVITCVDEACLPIKVFHGHVAYLKDKCDLIITPRIVREVDGRYICPKFCGIPEMIKNSVSGLPPITTLPIELNNRKSVYAWCRDLGRQLGKKDRYINAAFNASENLLYGQSSGLNDQSYPHKIALLGHSYNLCDNYVNMAIVEKLHDLHIGVITEDRVSECHKAEAISELVKKPFWTNMANNIGAGVYLSRNHLVHGMIYLSSFQCGIDSITIDVLKDMSEDFPILILKLDEHTGQAGMETRVEAFIDMLKRRNYLDLNLSTHG